MEKYLKYLLIFFFIVDLIIFILSQVQPDFLLSLLPQFDIESNNNTYPRLVGILFLSLGLARLYGGLFIKEKGAFMVSIWSWVVELIYTLTELARGEFILNENLMALVLAPLMLFWSLLHFKKTWLSSI
ncbi:hypothetical protein [Tenacibaculum xiamenense]|uniref:hypothetical protein n=1 Tax=Tenacibaculum xiamenense TaxID=1261553 RepID=UPI0038930EDF